MTHCPAVIPQLTRLAPAIRYNQRARRHLPIAPVADGGPFFAPSRNPMISLSRFWLFALCLVAVAARAQLTIDIIGGGATTIPIAIVPFAGEQAYPLSVTGVVGADLTRSGLFRLVDSTAITPRPSRAGGRALRRLDRARRRRRRRRDHGPAAGWPDRGALHSARRRQAGAARADSPTSSRRRSSARPRIRSPM